MNQKKHTKMTPSIYAASLGFVFIAGSSPALLTLGVDPYEVFSDKDRDSTIADIAEKRHYPLFKLAKYNHGAHDTIILGDSRARSLKNKYWHEIGLSNALNLAYGGGTIPEIFSTFNEIKEDEKIKHYVIGIQLRSFDEKHKDGLNRVPEAFQILTNKSEYLKNWTIANTALSVFNAENKNTMDQLNALLPSLSSEAHAASLKKLLEPENCFSCVLPQNLQNLPYRTRIKGPNLGLGRGDDYHGAFGHLSNDDWQQYSDLYALDSLKIDYAPKIARQIKKNGRSDWQNFQFSKKYWSHIMQISEFAKTNGKSLTFIIPPTVQGMQNTIVENALAPFNHQFRMELAKLGKVFDFDFASPLTADQKNFEDAYHFNSSIARQIVGEVALQIEPSTHKLVQKKRDFVLCKDEAANIKNINQSIELTNFNNCRIWEEKRS